MIVGKLRENQHCLKDVQDFSSTKASSRFVMDENTLECRSISLTYDMDEAWCKRHLGLKYLSVAGYMEDVFRLSSMKQERGLAYLLHGSFLCLDSPFLIYK